MDLILTITITSAVTAALVSGSFAMINAKFDRDAREKEMKFKLAFELAHARANLAVEIWKKANAKVGVEDPIHYAQEYHNWVKHFYDKGVLPIDAINKRLESLEKPTL